MTEKVNDGGPAFPTMMKVCEVAVSEGGMSLRAYFAGKALPHALSGARSDMVRYGHTGDEYLSAGVREACRIADALIAQLAKGGA